MLHNSSFEQDVASLALYLHVPYCKSRCSYCDFNAHVLPDQEPFQAYTQALLKDIEAQERASIETIFWGGGTPSLLPLDKLTSVVNALRRQFDLSGCKEHTIEVNPGTITEEKLQGYLERGIDRLSMGAQSFHPRHLELVGRIHQPNDIVSCFETARRVGFENVSLDLIYGFPEQTVEQWKETLEAALSLAPDHLSVYQLTIEPSTRLEAQLAQGELELPPEDDMIAMDEWAETRLLEADFHRYEISNWAKPGRECRHNLIYWADRPYLGLGCGAVSFLNGWRIERIKPPVYYQRALEVGRAPVSFAERRGADGALKDHLMMALRVEEGVDSDLLCSRYAGLTPGQLEQFFGRLPSQWWSRTGNRFRLTRAGWDFHSEVTMELMRVMFSFS